MDFNKATLKVIREKMQEALNDVSIDTYTNHNGVESLGLTIVVGNCSYDEHSATFKVNITKEGGASKEERDLKQMAPLHHLDLDKVATINGNLKVKLSGYRSRARSKPYMVRSVDDPSKQYIISTDKAKDMFGDYIKVPTS